MANIEIRTKGMHCTSCETLVKDALEELDGINKIEVNYKTGIVKVDFDESKVSSKLIKTTIEKEGYEAE